MEIIPAVDIKNGVCVRLKQGVAEDSTTYGDDPIAMAKTWEAKGATRLHVVDLDGAFDGRPANIELVKGIARELKIPVQTGGGIRNGETVSELLDSGIASVILGTIALEKPELTAELAAAYPGRVSVGIDARNGLVAVRGWVDVSEVTVEALLEKLKGLDLASIIYTDIARDGMLQGPNVPATDAVCNMTDLKIIASGGVSCVDDLKALAQTKSIGAIVGKALYDGNMTLKEAMDAVK